MSTIDEYVDVATRIAEFREKHPEGSLTRLDLQYRKIGDVLGEQWYVEYTAAAYRFPDDPRPGVGTAWVPIPGRTEYTRDSEVQNAETAAWGRAIVAALAADTRSGVASRDEIQNRHETEIVDLDPLIAYAKTLQIVDIEALWSGLAGFAQPIRDEVARIARDKVAAQHEAVKGAAE